MLLVHYQIQKQSFIGEYFISLDVASAKSPLALNKYYTQYRGLNVKQMVLMERYAFLNLHNEYIVIRYGVNRLIAPDQQVDMEYLYKSFTGKVVSLDLLSSGRDGVVLAVTSPTAVEIVRISDLDGIEDINEKNPNSGNRSLARRTYLNEIIFNNRVIECNASTVGLFNVQVSVTGRLFPILRTLRQRKSFEPAARLLQIGRLINGLSDFSCQSDTGPTQQHQDRILRFVGDCRGVHNTGSTVLQEK